jgi:hypothetical protein
MDIFQMLVDKIIRSLLEETDRHMYFFIIIIYLNCKWVSTGGSSTTIGQHINNTHHTQTKQSTQIYTNNKGHTTHN